jgi:hypothetical protein
MSGSNKTLFLVLILFVAVTYYFVSHNIVREEPVGNYIVTSSVILPPPTGTTTLQCQLVTAYGKYSCAGSCPPSTYCVGGSPWTPAQGCKCKPSCESLGLDLACEEKGACPSGKVCALTAYGCKCEQPCHPILSPSREPTPFCEGPCPKGYKCVFEHAQDGDYCTCELPSTTTTLATTTTTTVPSTTTVVTPYGSRR